MSSEIPDQFASFPERYVDTREKFEDFVSSILSEDDLACCSIDTEADSMHSYETKLCLIQFSTPKELAIIDPLSIGLDGLQSFPEFIDQFEHIWMHGADYDISMFNMSFEWAPHRILDTQIAARLLGETKFGLANLLEGQYGIKVSKQSQKADWSQRPLSEKMLAYAFNDVRYLLDLASRFTERMKQAGRYEWFVQSCDAARTSVFDRGDREQRDVWRVNGWGKLSSRGLNYLKHFWVWRDDECRRLDRPAFKFLGNSEMLRMVGELEEGKGVNPPHYIKRGALERLEGVIRKAEEVPESEYPSKRIRSNGVRLEIDENRFERIRAIRNRVASDLGIEGTMIATRGIMERMASSNLPVAERTEGLLPWQMELLSEALD